MIAVPLLRGQGFPQQNFAVAVGHQIRKEGHLDEMRYPVELSRPRVELRGDCPDIFGDASGFALHPGKDHSSHSPALGRREDTQQFEIRPTEPGESHADHTDGA